MSVKLLDYKVKSPFKGIFGRERSLAWPVAAYRVTLPRSQRSEVDSVLNPFERVILKLLDARASLNATNAQLEIVLSNTTCLPVDFVRSILFRLLDCGYIDGNNSIIDEKRKYWALGTDAGEDEIRYDSAFVFRELCTGEFLPFIHLVSEATPLKAKYNDDERRFMFVLPKKNQQKWDPPTAYDVVMIKKTMHRRSLLSGDDVKIPKTALISVSGSPEYYYLDCGIAIREDDGDFRISDPFTSGFSLVLEKAFTTLLRGNQKVSNWFHEWRKNLSDVTIDGESEAENHPRNNSYPQLFACSRRANRGDADAIKNIHASLEWALFYYCAQRDCRSALNILELKQGNTQQEELLQKARELGFATTWKSKESDTGKNYFFQFVKPGKILDFKNGKAEMATVLAIALLLDENSNGIAEIKELARRHPDFLWRISKIKEERDVVRHGHGKKSIESEVLNSYSFLQSVVKTLLPDFQFPDQSESEQAARKRADVRLAAVTSLQEYFDFSNYFKLSESAQRSLVNAEGFVLLMGSSKHPKLNASSFIGNLYSALQATIRPHLQLKPLANVLTGDYFRTAREIAINAGFHGIPEHLGHVKPEMIRETLQGNDRSLGACLLSFIILADKEQLQLVQSRNPTFIDDVSDLIAASGHNNEIVIMDEVKIRSLRATAFRAINTLLEV